LIVVVRPEQIKQYIEQALACDHVEVTGDGHHFEAVIVCPGFAGKTRVQRHQMVYGALGERMREEIHALSMKTLAPEEWRP
jgi:acid stress-induced BolA-like protein IbaG/YrbA